MSDENEVTQQDGEVYNDHSTDNSVHHAVNLWPLVFVAIFAAVVILSLAFQDQIKHGPEILTRGKQYAAVGAILSCMPAQNVGNATVLRVMMRTPDDTFFDIYFRQFHEPIQAFMAIGTLRYHECGKADGQVVHCFDSFQVTHEGLPPLDMNGKRIEKK